MKWFLGICIGNHTYIWVQLKNICMSNNQVVAWAKAEGNFDYYEFFNYTQMHAIAY